MQRRHPRIIEFREWVDDIRRCERCFPADKKFCDVPIYRGNYKAFIVGLAPSLYRTQPGMSFTAKSKETYYKLLKVLELSREPVYTTNLVKCTLPKVKTGTIPNCLPFLRRELRILNPRQVILFGRDVTDAVLGKGYTLNGKAILKAGLLHFPIPHPMWVYYNPQNWERYYKFLLRVKPALEIGWQQERLA